MAGQLKPIMGGQSLPFFPNINQVREETDKWMDDYNNFRPHDSLGGLSPKAYLKLHSSRNIPAAVKSDILNVNLTN